VRLRRPVSVSGQSLRRVQLDRGPSACARLRPPWRFRQCFIFFNGGQLHVKHPCFGRGRAMQAAMDRHQATGAGVTVRARGWRHKECLRESGWHGRWRAGRRQGAAAPRLGADRSRWLAQFPPAGGVCPPLARGYCQTGARRRKDRHARRGGIRDVIGRRVS